MTSTFPNISISTDRLVLRPFEEADVPELVEMMNDEYVSAWTAAPVPYTEADARHYVLRQAPAERAGGRGVVFAVDDFLTRQLVGVVQLRDTDWRSRTTGIAYVIAPWARGEGYATEAVLAVARWLFEDRRFERLELRTAAGNSAAQQVAQKVGGISEGVLRNAWIARIRTESGEWTDTRTDLIVWGLLPEDLEGFQEEPVDTAYAQYAGRPHRP
ncbi:GNAT family N-acetyltransferase [Streptomyces sp. 549]|uniref:GNAT family N-acetyltransferase n=1 Tax=Streptomyces sp. 549 TaxID=3049076 RepID=UPI0024C40B09|nr:GNAT family N-acetyltransferase [Streptomyces sp. 549]MDK1473450.1 GNAT family N-acetyltransferase [Streptomyces sp. 549]